MAKTCSVGKPPNSMPGYRIHLLACGGLYRLVAASNVRLDEWGKDQVREGLARACSKSPAHPSGSVCERWDVGVL